MGAGSRVWPFLALLGVLVASCATRGEVRALRFELLGAIQDETLSEDQRAERMGEAFDSIEAKIAARERAAIGLTEVLVGSGTLSALGGVATYLLRERRRRLRGEPYGPPVPAPRA